MTDSQMDAPELLPCPFCGGAAHVDGTSWTTRDGKDQAWATCKKCGTYGPSSTNAIAAWNRRATPEALAADPAVKALVEAAVAAERERCVAIAVRHWEGEPEDTIAMVAEIRVGMKPLTEYERKVAQMREDFPNGI